MKLLDSFLETRGKNYSKEMSSPLTAITSCSRLSPYLTFGNLSVREVYKIAKAKEINSKELKTWELAVIYIFISRQVKMALPLHSKIRGPASD